ncbi:hypothetical protein CMU84_08345 [Elizabethkingia anophelis]|nr:hypothetical protein [Elizabethkingia anophelis]MDV3706777.1 hypothetical protein [Elizabethkingia anophelis]MDV3735234.1 hypothetical protein [Elizabethkingia anophelis]
MIADMIQLILVGSGEFKSSTDANKDRDVKGMLSASAGKSSSRGYVFLNIEVSPKKYIVIGTYIESTSNAAEMFILQNGYNWESLTPLNMPVFTKDLIVNDKIETLNNLCEKIGFARIKSFKRRVYHQTLYNNEILSLDLTKDETLKTYANILRSFSRGKGFKTESENLKKFLFGDDEQNIIIEKYREEVGNISNDFHEHKRYHEEIDLINKKQSSLKNALDKSKIYKSSYSEFLFKRYNYWNTLKRKTVIDKQKAVEELENKKIELKFVENQIKKSKIKDLEELLDKKKTITNLAYKDSYKEEIESKYFDIKQSKTYIETLDNWLTLNDNQLDKVKEWYRFQTKENENKRNLLAFMNYLKNNSLINDFDTSNWLIDFEKANKNFPLEIKQLKEEITELESLSKFSDLNNSESLVRWATENLNFPISHTVESILVYFQKYGKVKPSEQNANRYVPFPEELFENIDSKIKDKKDNHGFWLNLDGVYEYISYSPNHLLNVDSVESLVKPLSEIKEGVGKKLNTLIKEKNNKEKYKEILFKFNNLQENIDLYKRKDELISFNIEESLDISESKFEQFIRLYLDKDSILNQFNLIQKEYEDYLSIKTVIEECNKRIQKLEMDLFSNKENIDIEFVEKEITLDNKELAIQQNDLQELINKFVFDEALLQEKYLGNQSLLKCKYELEKECREISDDIQQKENTISISNQELSETEQTFEQLFKHQPEYDENVEEFSNPENGGFNSLKNKADRSKIDYEVVVKKILEEMNLPYDESISIGKLANLILPTVFPTPVVDENLISSNIADRLSKLTQDIQEIGSRKIEILGSIFNEVYKVYTNYLTKINEIDAYLKKKNKIITGGNRASLTSKKSIHYPDSWLGNFRKQLNTQINNTGLFSELREEIDINKMMIKAFQQLGGSTKVEPEDLMNPKSYFDLEFYLKLDNDEINSGSHGQTYTANALLCLARLSLIEEKGRKGLKIMPIDEAEGLGSNYDMLHELAKKEQYQVLTMAIETAGEITNDGQYIYIMNENNLASIDTYVPPLGIFANQVFQDIDEYINTRPDDE